MKKILFIILAGSVLLTSCKKFLDINSDPDTPQNPDPTSVFPVLISNIPGAGGERGTGGVQFDALWIGSYIQFWHAFNSSQNQFTWDAHGHNGHTADRAAGIWRATYFGVGKNMEYCIEEGQKRGQWDVVGAALAIKAYLFQLTTNYHGEIIFHDAFKEDSLFFRWDDQKEVYKGVDSLARLAIAFLDNKEYNPASLRLTRGDLTYGNSANFDTEIARWKKFAYGVLARNFSAIIHKPQYSADSVIKYTDLAMANGADDFVVPFEASRTADANIFGTYRDNMTPIRQSDYIVRLLDGSVFAGSNALANRDPRIRHMLVASPDTLTYSGNGGYRVTIPGLGDTVPTASTRRRVPVLWGDSLYSNPGNANFAAKSGKYLFQNKAVMPVMTYSEMQFLKAEAALRKGDATTAHTAYKNGINGHFDFINRTSYPRNQSALFNQTPLSAQERTAYLASANVKQNAADLRLSDIMQQKFIALWGWGFVETWTDMRKYHYWDIDDVQPGATEQVYSGMMKPVLLFADNNGKYAYRVRPRYNSEYVWNIYMPEIANSPEYHTIETWFSTSQP
ncbi:SusD/RagB family nutrient-binding outer membrane lipoprotein [Pseudoflavitalea sp. X16]|uniref:SusD/RagB family nutrient-binding outer membrane lipoprotein n=1 Tax=Paraflavitalea devenefica TaxID=2716334 RepID=UPI00141FE4F7|nr:SusD/RagB family nutrient-binding outer membrane lipoprotein [Paraflavitalea devenefica]NII29049.1 SusD/RagB family nutrient-binding outer membrane lipoprotein [Paraflavitalea devenefica]